MNKIEKMVEELDPETIKYITERKDFEQQACEIEDGLQRYLDMVSPAFGHRNKKNCMITDALLCAIQSLIADADKVMSKR